jgi:hypothetical protein
VSRSGPPPERGGDPQPLYLIGILHHSDSYHAWIRASRGFRIPYQRRQQTKRAQECAAMHSPQFLGTWQGGCQNNQSPCLVCEATLSWVETTEVRHQGSFRVLGSRFVRVTLIWGRCSHLLSNSKSVLLLLLYYRRERLRPCSSRRAPYETSEVLW